MAPTASPADVVDVIVLALGRRPAPGDGRAAEIDAGTEAAPGPRDHHGPHRIISAGGLQGCIDTIKGYWYNCWN